MNIRFVRDKNFMVDGGAMFGVVPKSVWMKYYACDENNLCNLSNRCLLIEEGDKKILIDAGCGDKYNETLSSHYLLNGAYNLNNSLIALGVTPEEITDVIFTHLHFDHCGGAIINGNTPDTYKLTFPNATYRVSKSQWEYATNPDRRDRSSYPPENIIPLKESGKITLIENNQELFPGISLRLFNGHTAGLIGVIIQYGHKTLAVAGDLIPTIAHIPITFVAGFDNYPLTAQKEKEKFLNEAVEGNYILFFQHDINTECCSLQQTPRGVREKERFLLTEIL